MTNLGALWASQGKVVVMVDMDLAAPGISCSELVAKESREPKAKDLGFSDMMNLFYNSLALSEGRDKETQFRFLPPSLLLHSMKVPGPVPHQAEDLAKGRLWVIPTGLNPIRDPQGNIPQGLFYSLPSPQEKKDESSRHRAVRALAKAIKSNLEEFRLEPDARKIDYVLLDTRTGFPELIDLSLSYLADRIVLVSGLNQQNQNGLENTLKALQERNCVPLGEYPRKVVIAFSPIPLGDDAALVSDALEAGREMIIKTMRTIQPQGKEPTPKILTIHYTAHLAVSDEPLVVRMPRHHYSRDVKAIADWIQNSRQALKETQHWTKQELENQGVVFKKIQTEEEKTKEWTTSPFSIRDDQDQPALRLNPMLRLPSWYWPLSSEDQLNPTARLNAFFDWVGGRPEWWDDVDLDALLDGICHSTSLQPNDKQQMLMSLITWDQVQVTGLKETFSAEKYKNSALDEEHQKQLLVQIFHQQKQWAGILASIRSAENGRFFKAPLAGVSLFPNLQSWPEYWLLLAHDLFAIVLDQEAGFQALERAFKMETSFWVLDQFLDIFNNKDISKEWQPAIISMVWKKCQDNAKLESRLVEKLLQIIPEQGKALLLKLLNYPPDRGVACLYLARAVLSEVPEWSDKVEPILIQATINMPKVSSLFYMLGELYSDHLYRFDPAEKAYKSAIAIDDGWAFPYAKLANLFYCKLGRAEEAEELYRKAISLQPYNSAILSELGHLLCLHLHRYEEAEQVIRRAIVLDNNNWPALHILGQLRWNGYGDCNGAITAFKKAIPLANEENIIAPNLYLANLLRLTGKHKEAASHLSASTEHLAAKEKSLYQAFPRYLCGLYLNNPENIRMGNISLHEWHKKTLWSPTLAFLLYLHAVIEGREQTAEAQFKEYLRTLLTHTDPLDALTTTYNTAGWRPDLKESMRGVARRIMNLPPEVIARLGGTPTPEKILNRYQPFLQGESEGLGDPRDLKLFCRENNP